MDLRTTMKCIDTMLGKCSLTILFHMTVPQKEKIHAHLFSFFDKSLIRKTVLIIKFHRLINLHRL